MKAGEIINVIVVNIKEIENMENETKNTWIQTFFSASVDTKSIHN